MRYYPQFTREYVENDLAMMQGWAFLADAIEHDGWLSFGGLSRTGKGYVGQEIDELVKQAAHLWMEPIQTVINRTGVGDSGMMEVIYGK